MRSRMNTSVKNEPSIAEIQKKLRANKKKKLQRLQDLNINNSRFIQA